MRRHLASAVLSLGLVTMAAITGWQSQAAPVRFEWELERLSADALAASCENQHLDASACSEARADPTGTLDGMVEFVRARQADAIERGAVARHPLGGGVHVAAAAVFTVIAALAWRRANARDAVVAVLVTAAVATAAAGWRAVAGGLSVTDAEVGVVVARSAPRLVVVLAAALIAARMGAWLRLPRPTSPPTPSPSSTAG